jgi:septal ring factor EnvC (AmiA/AmiB activator)
MIRRLRFGRYAALVGLLLLLALVIAPGLAPANNNDPLEEYLEEQRQAIDGMQKTEKEIAASKVKKTAYEKEIVALDAQLVVLGQEIKAAQTAIAALNGQIE